MLRVFVEAFRVWIGLRRDCRGTESQIRCRANENRALPGRCQSPADLTTQPCLTKQQRPNPLYASWGNDYARHMRSSIPSRKNPWIPSEAPCASSGKKTAPQLVTAASRHLLRPKANSENPKNPTGIGEAVELRLRQSHQAHRKVLPNSTRTRSAQQHSGNLPLQKRY